MCLVCNDSDTGSPGQWQYRHFDKVGNGRGQIHPDIPQEPASDTVFSQRHRVLPLPAHTEASAIQINTSWSIIRVLGKNIFLLAFRLNPH